MNLLIDPSTKCQVSCTICPVYAYEERFIEPCSMTFEVASKIAAHFRGKVGQLVIGNWSEPFLNESLFDIVDVFRKNGLQVISVNTNFSTLIDMARLLKSGITTLYVSLSGITEDVYVKYHRKGDLDLVLGNIREFASRQGKRGKPKLVVNWHRFKHNEHQREDARTMMREMGVGFKDYYAHPGCVEHTVDYLTNPDGMSEDSLRFIEESVFSDKIRAMCNWNKRAKACKQRELITVHADGSLLTCCALYTAYKDKSSVPVYEMTMKQIKEFKSRKGDYCLRCLLNGVAGYFNSPKTDAFYKGKI